ADGCAAEERLDVDGRTLRRPAREGQLVAHLGAPCVGPPRVAAPAPGAPSHRHVREALSSTPMHGNGRPWIVLRLDGAALADAASCRYLAAARVEHRQEGVRTLVVAAALGGLTADGLLARARAEGHEAVVRELTARLQAIGVEVDEPPPEGTGAILGDMARLLAGAHLLGEAGPRARARLGALLAALAVPLLASWLRREGVDAG